MTHHFLLFVLYALCVFRLTRLVVEDTITEKFRTWIELRSTTKLRNAHSEWLVVDKDKPWFFRQLYKLTSCAWCISFWIAAVIVPVAYYNGSWFQYVCAPFALSAVAGVLAERT